MSLILEALKKSERQRQIGTAPTLATPTMTRRRRRSPLPWLIGAIVIAAGAGWWLYRDGGIGSSSPEIAVAPAATPTPNQAPAAANASKLASAPMTTLPPPPPVAAAPPPAAAPPAAPASSEKQVAETAAAVAAAAPQQRAAPTPLPVTSAETAPASEATTKSTAVVPPPRTSPTPTGPLPPPPASPSTAAATPAATPAAVVAAPVPSPSAGLPLLWELPYDKRKDIPKLGMSLQVYSADPASRFAIVNDERRKEGDSVAEGLVLREITPEGLILEFQGERFLYPRGGR